MRYARGWSRAVGAAALIAAGALGACKRPEPGVHEATRERDRTETSLGRLGAWVVEMALSPESEGAAQAATASASASATDTSSVPAVPSTAANLAVVAPGSAVLEATAEATEARATAVSQGAVRSVRIAAPLERVSLWTDGVVSHFCASSTCGVGRPTAPSSVSVPQRANVEVSPGSTDGVAVPEQNTGVLARAQNAGVAMPENTAGVRAREQNAGIAVGDNAAGVVVTEQTSGFASR